LPPVRQPASAPGTPGGLREARQPEESGPPDAGNGLNARRRRKFIPTTDSKHGLAASENILNREFHAEKGGQKRVSGITYLRAESGRVYLTVALDLFDRNIVGWALSGGMGTAETVIAALEMAVKNRGPQSGLLFHSDRGVQYCAQSFRAVLREKRPAARQGMSRKGNCRDNACAESFFKTLKRELETLDGKRSEAEVRQSVFMYIEAYYNRLRMHSALDYVAPNAFYLGNIA
jgi:transposase InsO family protein